MLTVILSFGKCILDFTLFFWFSMQFFSLRWKKYKLSSSMTLLILSVGLYSVNSLHRPLLNTFAALFCAFVINLLLFKGHIAARMLCAIAEVLLIVVCEFIPISVYSSIDKLSIAAITDETIRNAGFNLISTGIFSVIIILIRHMVSVRRKRENLDISISENVSIITVPLVSIFVIYYILFIQGTSVVIHESVSLQSIFIFLGILLMNIAVILGDNNLRRQYHLQRELDRLNRLEQLNRVVIEQQDQFISDLRGFAHDYTKQMAGIKRLISKNHSSTSGEIHTYLDEMCNTIEKNYSFAFISSPALRAILIQTQLHCNSSNIVLETDIQYADFHFLSFPDLYSIFENPLENAVRACKEIEDENLPKKIWLRIARKRNLIWVEIKNTKQNPIIVNNNCIQSTKTNPSKHGMGIKNMKRAISSYGGYINIGYNPTEFSVTMALPVPTT